MNQFKRKLALVIGVANYDNDNVSNLKNPVHDANDISTTLTRIGFSVTTHCNPTYWEMAKACGDFRKNIQTGDMIVFYFAGHGKQWNEKNYLLPKDYEDTEKNLENNALQAQKILDDFSDQNPFVIIFLLDCCRNYPIRDGSQSENTRNVNSHSPESTGLQPMNAKAGCLIAFACAPGTVSIDGEGERNGLFTKHLLRYIGTPNEDIRMILADVTKSVVTESCRKQIPYLSAALTEKTIFLTNELNDLEQTMIARDSPQYKNPVLEKKLSEYKNRNNLSLTSMKLNDDDMLIVINYTTQLSQLEILIQTLNNLFLCNNHIGAAGIKHLADALPNLTALTTLDLQYNQIGNAGLEHLSFALTSNKTLITLNLAGNQIEEKGVQGLTGHLQKNETLTTLNISSNPIGDTGAQYLTLMLLNKTTIKTLILVKNHIGSIGAQHLANALNQNNTLISLSLQYNQIGDIGAQHLSNALKCNKTLTTLDLSSNAIGILGVQHISAALQNNEVMTTLMLSFNNIQDQGVQYLAQALQHNSTLSTLGIEDNQISEKGAQYLADALLNNKILATLQLAQNHIGSTGAQHIVNALKKNTTLIKLTAWSNNIDRQIADELEEAIERNNRRKKV